MFFSPVFSPRPSRWRHVLATSLTLALCAASAPAQTAAPGRVRLSNSIRPVTALGEPARTATAATVRDTLTAAVNASEELEETAKLYMLLRGLNPRLLSPAQVAELGRAFGGPPGPAHGA